MYTSLRTTSTRLRVEVGSVGLVSDVRLVDGHVLLLVDLYIVSGGVRVRVKGQG